MIDTLLPVLEIEQKLKQLNPNGIPRSRWVVENKSRVIGYVKQWRKENPDKVNLYRKAYRHRRRTQLKKSNGSFTIKEWLWLLDIYGHRCAYCSKKSKHLTTDHIIPLSKGGTNYISNIIPACSRCNTLKNNHMDWFNKLPAQLAL